MLFGHSEREVTTTLNLLTRHLHVREQKYNGNTFGAFYHDEISRLQWCETHEDVSSEGKQNLLYLALPMSYKRAQCRGRGALWILEVTHSSLGRAVLAHVWSDLKFLVLSRA
jgi:hypothetical protein